MGPGRQEVGTTIPSVVGISWHSHGNEAGGVWVEIVGDGIQGRIQQSLAAADGVSSPDIGNILG